MGDQQARGLGAALVTGGGRGIGRGISLRLASDGFDVIVAYRDQRHAAEEVTEQICDSGRTAVAIQCDLSDPDAAAAIVPKAVNAFGRLNLFVGNAGQLVFKPFLETTLEDYERQTNTNARGSFFAAQAAARQMIEQGDGGRIIFITSDAAIRTYAGLSAYSMTKAAMKNLTEILAKELAPFAITVNAVAPGTTETDMNRAALADPATRSMLLGSILLGRPGQPKDVANAVSFLASKRASFITGATLAVDGGSAVH